MVRFVADSGQLYALKSIEERLARREYRLLRTLAELNVPAVEVVGVVVGRGADADAILVTRYLEYSATYRALFSSPRGGQPADRLLDATAASGRRTRTGTAAGRGRLNDAAPFRLGGQARFPVPFNVGQSSFPVRMICQLTADSGAISASSGP